MPLLGYDVDPKTTKLVVNEVEAAQVEQVFRLYLQHGSLLPVVEELVRRGWSNKRWTTRKGSVRGGKPFDRTSVHRLLTNVAYAGRVRDKREVHAGSTPASCRSTSGRRCSGPWRTTAARAGRWPATSSGRS